MADDELASVETGLDSLALSVAECNPCRNWRL